MIFRVPARSLEATELFTTVLGADTTVLYLSNYDSIRRLRSKLTNFEVSADDDYITRLKLNFMEDVFSEDGSFETFSRHLNLMVFGATADRHWPISMVNSVWRGKYPSCVGISDEGVVYLLFLTENSLELMTFALLPEVQLEALVTCCNRPAPYCISLEAEAMFNVLSGDEGMNHLRANVFIDFDTGIRTKVTPAVSYNA